MFKKGVRSLSLFYIRLNCGIYTSSPPVSLSRSLVVYFLLLDQDRRWWSFLKRFLRFRSFFYIAFWREIWRISLHLHIQTFYNVQTKFIHLSTNILVRTIIFYNTNTIYIQQPLERISLKKRKKRAMSSDKKPLVVLAYSGGLDTSCILKWLQGKGSVYS